MLSGSQKTQCMVVISGFCLRNGHACVHVLTRFAFICMEGSMKPSVELLRVCWLDH